MDKTPKKWRSPSLGKEMNIDVFGTSGTPILALPSRGKPCSEWKEQGMVESISFQLNNGFNQLFCVDSIEQESFLNERISPEKRVMRHRQFESYIIEEVVPFIRDINKIDFIIVAGVDTGGYHAINLALKHPNKFGKAIGISGVYDIKSFMNGYYSDDVYYNNPVDYIPNLNKRELLYDIRDVDFRLVTYQDDSHKEEAIRMGDVLRLKFIEHRLDIWDLNGNNKWNLWKQMLQTHII